MAKEMRQHYWSHLKDRTEFVNEKQFIYAFNESQKEGTWNENHSHETFGELVFVTQGIMVVCTEKLSFSAQTSRAIWIPPRLQHEWYMPTHTIDRSLYIHESVFKDIIHLKDLHIIEVSPLLKEMVIAVHDLQLNLENEADKRLALSLVDRICLAKQCTDIIPMPQNHKLVELCTEFIINPDIQIELSDWSEKLCMSEKTLARLFVKDTGLNFRTWKRTVRMQSAKNDLEAGAQVTETALNCGYSSLPSFITAFKNMYGISPSKLK